MEKVSSLFIKCFNALSASLLSVTSQIIYFKSNNLIGCLLKYYAQLYECESNVNEKVK